MSQTPDIIATPMATVESPKLEPAPSSSAPAQAGSVLSTLNDDGSRRWMKPRVSDGRFLTRRRIVAYLLIGIFALLPLARINGHPIVLLDIAVRRFHIFGATFYPTDTLLLALLLVGVFLAIFWITALLGRIWCGWACPQTVYMEFLYRPIEWFMEGAPGRKPRGVLQTTAFGKFLKHALFLVCSLVLSHIFLAYFVSWDNLRHWVFGSPTNHPIGFATVVLVTGGMLFNFGYFREQTCLLACPYGRFQSVLLDRYSLVIRYDATRGEPRGAKSKRPASIALPVLEPAPAGDCIDCRMCVTTCPTGIDIRNGLQMECVGCAQCIDACDAVMTKIDRPRGLIRYSSQAAMEGAKFKTMRPRVVLYPLVLLLLGTLFTVVLLNTGIAEVTILRGLGQPFHILPSGEIANTARVKITNRLERPAVFTLALSGVDGARLSPAATPVSVPPGKTLTLPTQILAPSAAFAAGRARAAITITGPDSFKQEVPFMLLGPHTDAQNKEVHP